MGTEIDIVNTILDEGDRFGRNNQGQGEKVQVEFVSANPTGPLHVGHGRGAAIGDCLCRLLEANGYDVTREFYYNDAGAQIDNLALSVQSRVKGLTPDDESWPADGYRLFEVGAPLRGGASHTTWFNRMFESNCLVLRRELFARLGGLDPRFDLPGGGFANLDFFKRASEAAGAELVQLVGEGSFHQVHGGATTNSAPAQREARLEAYREQYRALRGNSGFTTTAPLNFLGHLPTEAAKIHRRRAQQAAVSAPAAPSG